MSIFSAHYENSPAKIDGPVYKNRMYMYIKEDKYSFYRSGSDRRKNKGIQTFLYNKRLPR